MSRRHLRQVCERHSGLSVERDVSLRACLWSYPQPGDNRWRRREGNPGNHPGAGWQRWAVTVEREYTERGGVTRPTELALPPMSHHLNWVFDCLLLPLPSLCHSLPPQSFSRCRASSNRSALTGPSCVCTLTDCSFWLCVCVSKERRGSKSLFLASEESDFCGRAVRSTFPPRQINATTRQVASPDESHPPLWRVPTTTGNMFFQIASW